MLMLPPTHKRRYDVPLFVRAVLAATAADGFGDLDERAQLEALFGRRPGSAARGIGRYCSLNLRRLTSYGTLEFRRFHATLDPALLILSTSYLSSVASTRRSPLYFVL